MEDLLLRLFYTILTLQAVLVVAFALLGWHYFVAGYKRDPKHPDYVPSQPRGARHGA